VAVLVVTLIILNPFRVGSIEKYAVEWPYTLGLCTLYAALLFSCAQFLHIWLDLRQILRMLERHPIREAFRRLPKELSPALVWRWGGSGQPTLAIAHSMERFRTLALRHKNYQASLGLLEPNVQQLLAAESYGQPVPKTVLKIVRQTLVHASNHLVANVLAPSWSRGISGAAPPVALSAAAGSSAPQAIAPVPSTLPSDVALAEEFVALRFVAMIRYVTVHLKNLLEFVAAGLMLAIVSLNSYPFEPHHSIMTVISVCFFALSVVFFTAFVQMNRDTIISYLSNTTPGSLDSNLLHVASFGALPLVTVLASQFPSVGGFLFSWVKPALETLR
jgi:hypothetical protein